MTNGWRGITALGLLLSAAGGLHAQDPQVTGVRVEREGGESRVVVEVEGGEVRWTDFTLSDPARVVIDVEGARSALARQPIIPAAGGAVRRIRTSQYTPDVVRVVLDLDRERRYRVERDPAGLGVALGTEPAPFDPVEAEPGITTPGYREDEPVDEDAAAGVDVISTRQETPRITVSFESADIQDVLASFAEFTGRSIVPGAGVEGTVTATIRDQPWDVALQTILRAYGLAAQELPTGILQVDAIERLQARQAQEPLLTQTYRINYVPVQELQATLQPLLTERGRLSVNPSTNTLVATDVSAVIDNLGAMVGRLDVRTPQVSIQAKIVFVNRTDVEELGVTYDLKDSQGNSLNRLVSVPDPFDPGEFTNEDLVLLGGNSIAALGNANTRVTGASLEVVTSLVLGRFTLIGFIDALESAELSDVQAAPLITTLDNQPAEIWVGERTPIRVVDVGVAGAAGAGAAPRATAELVETGIRLRVVPHITADRQILMELHAERSSAQLAATEIGVIFQQQQGETRLMVADGETAVIGGLTVTEVAETRAGIPFLSDLPWVGALFRTTRKREQKRDLLIMVTPHIVEERG